MNEKAIAVILKDLAEEQIPSSEINLLPTLKNRIQPVKPTAPRRNVLQLAVYTSLALLLACILFLATPQGQVWAGALLRFFRLNPSDTLPLPAGWKTEAPVSSRTPVPTQMLELRDATPLPGEAESATPTLDGTSSEVEGDWISGLSLEEAQQMVDFEICVPADLPEGYALSDVFANPAGDEVWQLYAYSPYQAGEMFILSQQSNPLPDTVGSSAAVEELTIGGRTVEYVQGGWMVAVGESAGEWSNDAGVHTYRWEADGLTYTMQFMLNETFSPAYLDPAMMTALVEVVMGVRTELPEALNLNALALDEVESATGFDVLFPSVIPEGFIFDHAAYEPENQRVVLIYSPENGSHSTSGTNLVIFEFPLDDSVAPVNEYAGYPSDAVQAVKVGDAEATLVTGGVMDGAYDPDFGYSLEWQTGTLRISLRFYASSGYGGRLTGEDMIEIGESME